MSFYKTEAHQPPTNFWNNLYAGNPLWRFLASSQEAPGPRHVALGLGKRIFNAFIATVATYPAVCIKSAKQASPGMPYTDIFRMLSTQPCGVYTGMGKMLPMNVGIRSGAFIMGLLQNASYFYNGHFGHIYH